MSKGKKSTVVLNNDSDDGEYSQSQTLTQAHKAVASLSKVDKDRKVADLVMYLLIADQKKYPIKRIEINKSVLKEHSKAFSWFIEEASKRLKQYWKGDIDFYHYVAARRFQGDMYSEDVQASHQRHLVFGITLVEIDGKQKSYILVSDIEHDAEHPHLEWPASDNTKTGLLMVILSLVFMNGNVMTDELLYRSLRKLGVDVDSQHEEFGDVKKLLSQEFVRQGYVEYSRQPNVEPPIYEYSWGPRARHETSKRMVLNFVCQIYGDMDPKNWTSQFQDVTRSEGEAEMEVS